MANKPPVTRSRKESLDEIQALIDASLASAVDKAVSKATAHLANEITNLKLTVLELQNEVQNLKKKNNQLEQYSRRSNIRIRGLQVPEGSNCKEVVAKFLSEKLKGRNGEPVKVKEEDLDAAHPLPTPKTKPRTAVNADESATNGQEGGETPPQTPSPVVIVKFHNRDTRDFVIRSRRSLKDQPFAIQDDLTRENAALLQRLKKAPSINKAWSWEGKIYGTVYGIKKPKKFDILEEL
jgi:FtsZ-binding cell division protein ZapB